MGFIAGYPVWVPLVGRERVSHAWLDAEAKIVRMPNKPRIAENLLFCPP
jgi:hypothetical protein